MVDWYSWENVKLLRTSKSPIDREEAEEIAMYLNDCASVVEDFWYDEEYE